MQSLSQLGVESVQQVDHGQQPKEEPMTAKAETEELMNAGIPFAEQQLTKHGEFFPFAILDEWLGRDPSEGLRRRGRAA